MSLEVNGEVLVSDLGADKIWRLVNDGAPGNFKIQGQINIDAGAGPRHMAILDNLLFTVHEKTSTLTVQPIPQGPNGTTLPLIANVSIVPPNPPEGSQFAGAELLISTPSSKFPNPLIYVSNRNIGNVTDPKGDTIAIFEFKNNSGDPGASNINAVSNSVNNNGNQKRHEDVKRECQQRCGAQHGLKESNRKYNGSHGMKKVYGKRAGGSLELVAQVFTGLQQIRSMNLGHVEDGGDEFLVASGFVGTGGVVMFQRVDGGRNLQEVARNTDVATRTSFVFV